ncbi:hypothetical protein [Shewanella gaetbuli]
MDKFDFDGCQDFLEYMIQRCPDNTEYLNAYVKINEMKLKLELASISNSPEKHDK